MMFTPPISPLRRDGDGIVIIDQTLLPYVCETLRLDRLEKVTEAIRCMQVRGAPLIGATAAFGIAIALRDDASDERLDHAVTRLAATRPTAVNLHWALKRMRSQLLPIAAADRYAAAWNEAESICAEDQATCAAIGAHGLALLRDIAAMRGGEAVNIMTHCNAGWLATLGAGTALAPIYHAHALGLPVHVWVSETRPRNQGLLTEWELRQAGVPHSLIADNAAGLLIATGKVDIVITGADRVAANGDSANKIGTYLKALAAGDNRVPFYIAAPCSTIDFDCADGTGIPIEDRGGDEVRSISGLSSSGSCVTVQLAPAETAVSNPAFDVTPARLISGIVTEHGVCRPDQLRHLQSALS